MTKVDITIVGAGVIGLAIAHELSSIFTDLDLVILEKNSRFGQEISSRNSEVIHSGIYYPIDSLKSKLCLAGNRLLYQFCAANHIRHQQLGKLIVAANEADLRIINDLLSLGLSLGLPLQLLDQDQLKFLEPNVRAEAAIFSPTTGIIAAEEYLRALYEIANRNGVMFGFNNEVTAIAPNHDGFKITTSSDNLDTKILINAAGLYSDSIAAMAGISIIAERYQLYYCKGEYYRIKHNLPVKHLIYPPPEHAGLGIHLTHDLAGAQRLGPSSYYVTQLDYDLDTSHWDNFYQAAHSYLPGLSKHEIEPDFAGIRPKLQGPNDTFRDFIISEETAKGLPGMINLVGIESPGLTASLAIAKMVTSMVQRLLA